VARPLAAPPGAGDTGRIARSNLEIVRGVYEAAAERRSADVLAAYDPDVEIDASRVPLAHLTGEPIRRGHDGLRTFFGELNEAWDNLDYSVNELFSVDDERVVACVTRRGRGRESGVAVELTVAIVWTLRGGRVVRVEWWPSRAEALASLDVPG
jgi:ketosteroid isomerase-like protein